MIDTKVSEGHADSIFSFRFKDFIQYVHFFLSNIMHATATYPWKAHFKIGLTNQYFSAVPQCAHALRWHTARRQYAGTRQKKVACPVRRGSHGVYRVIQKSLYPGQMVSLFTKHILYGYHYTDSTYRYVSPIQGELALTHLVLCARMHLECVP
jgi:hypothetical protein